MYFLSNPVWHHFCFVFVYVCTFIHALALSTNRKVCTKVCYLTEKKVCFVCLRCR